MAKKNTARGPVMIESDLDIFAATQMPEPQPIKTVRAGERAFPGFMTARTMPANLLNVPDRNLAYTDISRTDKRAGTRSVLRSLAHSSPDVSAAVFSYLRTAITADYHIVARNRDGTFNREATDLAWQIANRFDMLPEFSEGFVGTSYSIRSISESLAKEMVLYGAMAGELVLDKALTPLRIQPLTVTNIDFKPKQKRLVPVQTVGGDEIELDTPVIKYLSLDQELMEAYSSSPLESVLQPTFFNEEFFNLLRRAVNKALYPRMQVTLDEASIRKYAPAQYTRTPETLRDYVAEIVQQVQEAVNNLNPEDALVHQDYITVSMINNGNISLSSEIDTLKGLIDAKTSTGTKAPPAILGHHVGSSNIASTETLLFMKNVEGAVQSKLDEFFSYMLTLGTRLMGVDCFVEFKYDRINLRPSLELETFRAQKQSNVLELLSLGLISDEVAALELTGYLPPSTMPPLSGTMFRSKVAENVNGYEGETNDGSALNQGLKSDAPKNTRGGNNRRNAVKE